MGESGSEQKTSRESMIAHTSEVLRILGSPDVVESKTLKLIELADKHGVLASCSPIGGAAGVVYIAGILTENLRTLAAVAEATGISSATARKWKMLRAREPKVKKK